MNLVTWIILLYFPACTVLAIIFYSCLLLQDLHRGYSFSSWSIQYTIKNGIKCISALLGFSIWIAFCFWIL